MTRLRNSMAALALLTLASCGGRAAAPPPFLLGDFVDDYGMEYRITAEEWLHRPDSRLRIVEWNVSGQYLIAQNESANVSDGGLWTRIDWMQFEGMPPYEWGYCYSVYDAPTADSAGRGTVADRSTPRTGCNGHPFSRMRRPAESP